MAQYAKKTCNICGVIDIQPNMVREKKEVITGRYDTKVTGGNVLGAMAGSKASANAVRRGLIANNRRERTAYREVWMCKDCASDARNALKEKRSLKTRVKQMISDAVTAAIGYTLFYGGVFLFVGLCFWFLMITTQ